MILLSASFSTCQYLNPRFISEAPFSFFIVDLTKIVVAVFSTYTVLPISGTDAFCNLVFISGSSTQPDKKNKKEKMNSV